MPRGSKQAKRPTAVVKPADRKAGGFDLLPRTQIDEYAWPWALALLAVPGVGLFAHRLWQGWPVRAVVFVAFLLSAALLARVGWIYSGPRQRELRLHTSVSLGLAGVGAGITSLIGFARPWADVLLWGGCLVALTWNLRRMEVIRGDGRDDEADGFAAALGLSARALNGKATVKGEVVETPIRFGQGQTIEALQGVLPALESMSGHRRGALRAVPHPSGVARLGVLVLQRLDVLEKSTPWPGLPPVGALTDGVPFAVRGDGTVVRWFPVVEGTTLSQLQIMGQTRRGKSHLMKLAVVDLVRCGAVVWVSDTIKGEQSLSAIRPLIDWTATTVGQTSIMFDALDRVIRDRADWLGRHGFDPWRVGCGLPLLVVWIEEAARVVGTDRFVRLLESSLSAGVVIVNSMQRASHDNLPTSARAQIQDAICFGVKDATDASFVLGEDVIAAGAAPERWKVTRKGACIAQLSHQEIDQDAAEARTYSYTDRQLAEAVREVMPQVTGLDDVTLGAVGDLYAGCTTVAGVTVTARVVEPDSPAYGTPPVPTASAEVVSRETREESTDMIEHEENGPDPELETPDPGDMAEELAAADPLADWPEIEDDGRSLPDPYQGEPPVLSPEQRDQVFVAALDRMPREFKFSELHDVWLDTPGLTREHRPKLSYRVGKLVEAGSLVSIGGRRYRKVDTSTLSVGA